MRGARSRDHAVSKMKSKERARDTRRQNRRDDFEARGAAKTQGLNSKQIYRILEEHGHRPVYVSGGVTGYSDWTKGPLQKGTSQKFFKEGYQLGRLREWLGY